MSVAQLTPSGTDTPGLITITVPASTLGAPASTAASAWSGWTFTVTLAGQDGFSPDDARSFASTPQPYQFGVCSPGGTQPICSVDPANVPKVMDTIPPASVDIQSELDPTSGPVVIQGVTVP